MITHGDMVRIMTDEAIAEYSTKIVANTVQELSGYKLNPEEQEKIKSKYLKWAKEAAVTPE